MGVLTNTLGSAKLRDFLTRLSRQYHRRFCQRLKASWSHSPVGSLHFTGRCTSQTEQGRSQRLFTTMEALPACSAKGLSMCWDRCLLRTVGFSSDPTGEVKA